MFHHTGINIAIERQSRYTKSQEYIMYQRQLQKTQLQITAHLAQTMTLLNMNVDDIRQEIERTLSENPALIVEEHHFCPTCKHMLTEGQICSVCSKPKILTSDEAVVFISPRSDFYPRKTSGQEDLFSDEIIGSESVSLEEYVLSQIIMDLADDEKIIAAYILNQLDEDGFFKEKVDELANYYHVKNEKIERILTIIQRADPVGVGSSSPKGAIRIQLSVLQESGNIPDYYMEIAEKNLELLLKKNYKVLSKIHNFSVGDIRKVSDFFSSNLNPFPARAHWGTFRQPSEDDSRQYSNPDVIISYLNNNSALPLIVEVIIPSYSNLDINPYYLEVMKETDKETKEKLRIDIEKANLFIKCIQQRNNTMQRLMEKIIDIQKPFITKGEKHSIPITRVQISEELNLHESTISRAVANKSVQLPNGRIIPMSTFFDRSLGIRAEIRGILAEEDKTRPFSDSELVKRLSKKGHKIARRTVAKYRAVEGILPAHQRKNDEKEST